MQSAVRPTPLPRFKYMLDLSNFERLNVFELEGIEFQCNAVASGLLLPPLGAINVIRNCVFNRPGDRGITSIGDGCQGLLIDHCQFLSNEGGLLSQNRTSIGLNTNANDVKIRNCRASQFRHFAVISGAHNIVSGNHFFQGDDALERDALGGDRDHHAGLQYADHRQLHRQCLYRMDKRARAGAGFIPAASALPACRSPTT